MVEKQRLRKASFLTDPPQLVFLLAQNTSKFRSKGLNPDEKNCWPGMLLTRLYKFHYSSLINVLAKVWFYSFSIEPGATYLQMVARGSFEKAARGF